jgi:hypothetical protein
VVDTKTLVAIESLALKVECEFKHTKAQHEGRKELLHPEPISSTGVYV